MPRDLARSEVAGGSCLEEALQGSYGQWRSHRDDAARALLPPDTDILDAPLARLLENPVLAIGSPEHRRCLRKLLRSSEALLKSAARLGRDHARRALALETVELEQEEDGGRLVLLGPLHPLWLGAAFHRYQRFINASDALSSAERRAVEAALTDAPPAPLRWPSSGGGELLSGRTEAGLLVFESEPENLSDEEIRRGAKRVLEAYLGVHPHALLSTRVAVESPRAGPIVDGMCEVLQGDELPLRGLEVHLAASARSLEGRATRAALDKQALQLHPMSGGKASEEIRPHLILGVGAGRQDRDSEQEDTLETSDMNCVRRFYLDEEILRVLTPVSRIPGAAAVEEALASSAGSRATGFLQAVIALSPPGGADLGRAQWRIEFGRSLAPRAPRDLRLVAYERLGRGGQIVAMAGRYLEPLVRTLTPALSRLGVGEQRPRHLRIVLEKIERNSKRGLVPLRGSRESVLAEGLMGLVMRREGAALIATLDPTDREILAGASSAEDPAGVLLLGVRGGEEPSLNLGYSTLRPTIEISVGADGEVGGPLGERLREVVRAIRGALSREEEGTTAVWELLETILWRAALEEGGVPDVVHGLFERAAAGERVGVAVDILLPPDNPYAEFKGSAETFGAETTFRRLDPSLIRELVMGGD